MSETDGTSGRPGPGSSGSVGSPPQATSETKPVRTVRPESSSGGTATKKAAAKTAAAKAAPPKGASHASSGSVKSAPAKKTAAPRPAKTAAPRPASPGRRVRLTVARVDPWSTMKVAFLLSVAIGIAMVVMVLVLWLVLKGMGLFDKVNEIASQLFAADGSDAFDILDYIGLAKVMSLSIVVGVIDVILITAIAPLGAFLYNVSSALVGGLQLTLTDD